MCGRATCANLMGVNHEKNDQFYAWWGLYVLCKANIDTQNLFCDPPSPSISKLIGVTFCRNSLNHRSLDLLASSKALALTAQKGSRLVPLHNALTITPFALRSWSLTPTWLATNHHRFCWQFNTHGVLAKQMKTAKFLAELCAVSVAHVANLLASCHYRGFSQSITLPLG